MKHLSYYFSSILFLSLSVWLESRNQAKLEKILNRRWHDILKGIAISYLALAPLHDNHGILTMSIYDFLLNPVTLGI
jgi:hypothetical protein